MKNVIIALWNQFKAAPVLAYANDSGYHSRDVEKLVQLNKFPFYNIIPFPGSDSKRIEEVPGINSKMSFKDVERHICTISIQYAVRAMEPNVAIMGDDLKAIVGILDFQDDMWDVIKSDPTLGGAVRGFLPGTSIGFDMIQDTEDRIFIAGGEMTIQFYKDVFLK
jgi:hypothetical protein